MRSGERIINIGSINADRVSAPELAVYALIKGALSAFSLGIARELGSRGVTYGCDEEISRVPIQSGGCKKASTDTEHIEESPSLCSRRVARCRTPTA
ncbi:hypothetical protein H7J75_04850 [Mycolicibacterium canariasense]|nr:hypothetical protein [Mycolicibacterium canariasense]